MKQKRSYPHPSAGPCELAKDVEALPLVLSYRLAYLHRRWLFGLRKTIHTRRLRPLLKLVD
jgi:hypothetical protein